MVDSRVRIRVGDDELGDHIRARFTHHNPHRDALRYMNINGWWAEPKEYVMCSDDGGGWISVPRGGFTRVVAEAKLLGRSLRVEDRRQQGSAVSFPDHDLTLRPYQEQAVSTLLERENCLLRAPTGSGKTAVAMAVASRAGLRTLVIVPNRKLLDQWMDRASVELHLSRSQIGEVRGGKYRIGVLTVGIAMSVAKHARSKMFADHFGMVVCDEVSLFAANSFFNAVDPLPAKYRIGVSASEKRKDKKEFLISDQFGDVACDLKYDDLVKSGHVLDVTFKVVPTDFRADWYGLPSDEDDDRVIDLAKLVGEMAADRDRNRLIVEFTREAARTGQVIVFAHTREHCVTLENTISGMGTDTGLLIGGDDYATEFNRAIQGLRTGSVRVGVGTYKAIALGIDIPRLGFGVCATPIAANKQLVQQVRGRVCRTATGKVSAELLYVWDQHVFPNHLRNLANWNARTVVWDRSANVWVPARTWIDRSKVGFAV